MEPISVEPTEIVNDVDEQSLHGVWERTGRKTSNRTLLLCVLAGAVGLAIVPFVGTRWWTLTAPLFAAGGFGGWGIADREYERRIAAGVVPPRALRVLRAACMTIGAAALAVAGLTALIIIVTPLIAGGWR
jgi:hypothetical protein